jgi:plastocyanin
MRLFVLAVSSILVLAALSACATERDADDTDDAVVTEATPTPAPADTDDDATDDVATDDEAVDDEATDDDVVDDAADDAAVDDATDDEVVDDATEDDATEEPAHEPTEHVIEIVNPHDYDPEEIRIVVGDTVRWVNNSDMPHTATGDPEQAREEASVSLPEGAEPWDSGYLVEPGDSFEVHDLISNARYVWRRWSNYVELNPHAFPAHIFRVRRSGPLDEHAREEF